MPERPTTEVDDLFSAPCAVRNRCVTKHNKRPRQVAEEGVQERPRQDFPADGIRADSLRTRCKAESGVSSLWSRIPSSPISDTRAEPDGVAITSTNERWTTMQVGISRLAVEGTVANVYADGRCSTNTTNTNSGTTSTTSNTSTTTSTTSTTTTSGTNQSDTNFGAVAATTISGASSVRGQGTAAAGVQVGPAFAGNGRGCTVAAAITLVGSPVAGEFGSTATSSAVRQRRKSECPVEVHVTEAGQKLYAFSKNAPTRHGRWSRMEEEYAKRIIRDFEDGLLDAAVGVGLRQFLASKLHCDVMRVTKKFCGWRCVGKQSFRPTPNHDGRTTRARKSMLEMEQTWLKTFEQTWLMAFSSGSSAPKNAAIDHGGGGGGGGGTTPASLGDRGSSTPLVGHPVPLSPVDQLDGGIGRLKSWATSTTTWSTRVEKSVAAGKSTRAVASSAKEELSEDGTTDPARLGGEGQAGGKERGCRVSEAPAEERDFRHWLHHRRSLHLQKGQRCLSDGHGRVQNQFRSFVFDGDDMNGHKWSPSASHGGSYLVPGVTSTREPLAHPREHQGFVQEQAAWPQQRRTQPTRTTTSRTQEDPREYARRYRGQVFREAPPGENGSIRAEHGMWRHGATMGGAGGKYPNQALERRLSAPGRAQGSRDDVVGRGCFRLQPTAFPRPLRPDSNGGAPPPAPKQVPKGTGGWRPCWSKSAASPVQRSREVFRAGYDQEAKMTASYRVAPRQASSRNQHHALPQFSPGQERWRAATEGKRTYEPNLAVEAGRHRLAKAPRVTGSFSNGGGGDGGGDHAFDDSDDYPMYQNHRRYSTQEG